jgi:hypothetical protein
VQTDYDYSEPLGIGSIQQLNDHAADTKHKLPLGFPIPKGEPMTPYRDRLNAGEYAATDATPKRKPRKRATTTKRSSTKRSAKKK